MRSAWFSTAITSLLALLSLARGSAVAAQDFSDSQEADGVRFALEAPEIVLRGIDFSVEVRALGKEDRLQEDFRGIAVLRWAEQSREVRFDGDTAGVVSVEISLEETGKAEFSVVAPGAASSIQSAAETLTVRCLPGIVSILPPLVAILLALVFRQVLVALFAGIWLGAVFANPGGIFTGLFAVVDRYFIDALVDSDHASIIVFTMLLGGMVGVMTKSGGTRGIVEALTLRASSPRAGQLTTWFLGLFVFFDDYANSLIVGNTMRPITDRLRISREKLAYLVDSTAAPVASIALISTWIGTEVGLIGDALGSLPEEFQSDPYGVFLESIIFRFYPVLALVMGFVVAWTGRDLWSMASAEKRARLEGKVYRDGADLASGGEEEGNEPDEGVPYRWFNAIVPVVVVILGTIIGLYLTGVESAGEAAPGTGVVERAREIVGSADSYKALLWSSFSGLLAAVLLAWGQRILGIGSCMKAVTSGFKAMLPAILILVLAWSLSTVTKELKAAEFLVAVLEGTLRPEFLPVLVFLTAAIVSFATGSSWGTMSILMPLVVSLAYGLSSSAGLDQETVRLIILGAVSSVLSGAVFGDHCSPISDTTIMSSLASGCDHIDHVRTQLPYALIVGGVAMLLGDIPTAFGFSPWLSLGIGAVALVLIVRVFGKRTDSIHRSG